MLEDFGEYLKRLGKVAEAVSWLPFFVHVSLKRWDRQE
jgi:hypothetical protein